MAFRLCTTYIAFYTLCTFHNLYQCHARFSDAGVPCYLRPSGDRCHYRAKPDSPTCTSEDDRRRLAAAARQLNRSIAVLEQKLIRLGVIPPDDACSKLPEVENGVVVYSDLNLKAGCVGRYVCNEGYTLQSIHGQKEFVCDEYGLWDFRDTSKALVKCLLTADQCELPQNITNGTVSYEDDDSNNIFVGNRIEYHCINGTELYGSKYRYCQRNGNWSDSEPECKEVGITESDQDTEQQIFSTPEPTDSTLAIDTTSDSESSADGVTPAVREDGDHNKLIIIAGSIGSAFLLVIVLIFVTAICKLVHRHFKKKKKGGVQYRPGLTLIDPEDNDDMECDQQSRELYVDYKSYRSPSKSVESSAKLLKRPKKKSKKVRFKNQ